MCTHDTTHPDMTLEGGQTGRKTPSYITTTTTHNYTFHNGMCTHDMLHVYILYSWTHTLHITVQITQFEMYTLHMYTSGNFTITHHIAVHITQLYRAVHLYTQ